MARRGMRSGAVIGERIRARRERLGLTQEGLAERVGMTAPRLNDLERGRSPRGPGGSTLARIATALETTLDELIPANGHTHAA